MNREGLEGESTHKPVTDTKDREVAINFSPTLPLTAWNISETKSTEPYRHAICACEQGLHRFG
jgi:hypothetical protein